MKTVQGQTQNKQITRRTLRNVSRAGQDFAKKEKAEQIVQGMRIRCAGNQYQIRGNGKWSLREKDNTHVREPSGGEQEEPQRPDS